MNSLPQAQTVRGSLSLTNASSRQSTENGAYGSLSWWHEGDSTASGTGSKSHYRGRSTGVGGEPRAHTPNFSDSSKPDDPSHHFKAAFEALRQDTTYDGNSKLPESQRSASASPVRPPNKSEQNTVHKSLTPPPSSKIQEPKRQPSHAVSGTDTNNTERQTRSQTRRKPAGARVLRSESSIHARPGYVSQSEQFTGSLSR